MGNLKAAKAAIPPESLPPSATVSYLDILESEGHKQPVDQPYSPGGSLVRVS